MNTVLWTALDIMYNVCWKTDSVGINIVKYELQVLVSMILAYFKVLLSWYFFRMWVNTCIIDLMQFCVTGYEQLCHERECEHSYSVVNCWHLEHITWSLLVTTGLYSEVWFLFKKLNSTLPGMSYKGVKYKT